MDLEVGGSTPTWRSPIPRSSPTRPASSATGYRITAADQLLPTLRKALDDDGVNSLVMCPVDYRENLELTRRLGSLDETL